MVWQLWGNGNNENSSLKDSQEDQEDQLHQCLLLDQQDPLKYTNMLLKLHLK